MMPSFISGRGYELICEISDIISDKKKIIKVAKSLSKFNDLVDTITEDRNTELKKIIRIYKEKSSILFDIVSEKCGNNLHKFLNIIPRIDKNNYKEILECILKIKKYSDNTFLDFLVRLHYSRLRKAILNNKNKKELYLVIEKENTRIFKSLETKREREEQRREEQRRRWAEEQEERERKRNIELETEKKYRKHSRLYSQFSKINIPNFKIIKNINEADFWGQETHCCLKKNGAASDLLIPIESSPIAGEFVGNIKDSKIMIYFWDMVEINNGIPYKTLILDNLESSKLIKFEEFEKLIEEINSKVNYKKIYLGYLRNDIECDLTEKYKLVKRQFDYLAGYRDIAKGYAIADSTSLFLLKENNDEEIFKLRKMNKADLHLTKYIEDYIYNYENVYTGKFDKTDYIYQAKLDSPCYIIDNNKTILGYIITRYRYYNENNIEIISSEIPKVYSSKKLYIEDIVFSKNKEVIKSIDMIIADFINYCNNNEIKEVYCDTNINSKNMKKRLENSNIKLIDKLQGITLNSLKKLGIYEGRIKIENKLK